MSKEKVKVFVDGQEGTTGLKINERLAGRDDIEILKIPEESRKDAIVRAEYLNRADVVYLCLPDDAAREAVSLVKNEHTRIIDASTAHRTMGGWAYGIPELGDKWYDRIKAADRVSVPGCFPTCYVMLTRPLAEGGVLPRDYPATCHAITGYSGGGRRLIGDFESGQKGRTSAFYGLTGAHKHLPEMQMYGGFDRAPVFIPVIGNFHTGMVVAVPLYTRLFSKNLGAGGIYEFYRDYYAGRRFVKVYSPEQSVEALEGGYLYADNLNGTNMIEIFIFAYGEQIVAASRLDNLGKGSSGAAVQCMNIMIGADEGYKL